MEPSGLVEVKTEQIDACTDESDHITSVVNGEILEPDKYANYIAPVRPVSPPYYTQTHIVGGKRKKSKEKKQYNCKTCKFKFTSKIWLIKHEKMHENMEDKAKLYKCNICGRELSQKVNYDDHMAAHAGRRPYICDQCGMDFTWYHAFYRHQQRHKNGSKAFPCHLCHRTYNNSWNLSRHLKEIHSSKQSYRCDICDEVFEKKNLYEYHMRSHRRQERQRNTVHSMIQEEQGLHTESSVIFNTKSSGEIADSTLADRISENSEIANTNISFDDDCCLVQNLSELFKANDKSTADTVYVNVEEIQGNEIKSSNDMIFKAPVDSNAKLCPQPFSCEICGKRVYNLGAHMRIHNGERPFKCCICDKDFAQREALKVHYRSHTGEKPYVCKICGKGFATKSRQKDHAQAHKGHKPYQCDKCDARFSWRCALSRHKRLHSTGPKTYACSICTYECWRKHDLVKHEKTHLYDHHYICDFGDCRARFTNKKHLNKHKRDHVSPTTRSSSRNGRLGMINTDQAADATDQAKSNDNLSTDTVIIKQEPVEKYTDHNLYEGTASMYITSHEGHFETLVTNPTKEMVPNGAQMETLANNTTHEMVPSCTQKETYLNHIIQETNPDSGKLPYTRGKRTHLNQDLQRLLSKKLCDRKKAKSSVINGSSPKRCLKPKLANAIHNGSVGDLDLEGLKCHKRQVTISMDKEQSESGRAKTLEKLMSDEKMVNCEICGNSLSMSYYHIHVRKHFEEMAHTCEICKKAFSRKTDLIVHSRVHTNIRPFQCTVCPKAFKVKSLLEDHMRAHDGIKPYVCSLCDASFAWRCGLHRHVKTHSITKPFKCDVCGRDFRRRTDWAAHKEKKTCKFVKSVVYKCHDCQAVFANMETLMYHNEKYHKEVSPETSTESSLDISHQVTNGLSPETAEISTESSLDISHPVTNGLSSDSILPKSIQNILNEKMQLQDDLGIYIQVNRIETKPSEVDNVQSETLPTNPVLLSNITCINGTSREGENEIESGDKSNILLNEDSNRTIKKEFSDSDSLLISNVVRCTELKKESCVTPNIVTQPSGHQIPFESDTTTSPVISTELPSPTADSTQMKTDVKETANTLDAVDEKLTCKLCGRGFISSIGLKIHLRVHSKDAMDIYALHFRPDELMSKAKREKEARMLKYKCELCEKTFPFASGLRIHMMAHTGRLPYSCKTCGKRFAYLESVKLHMRVHTGERPFTCDVCGKSFAYRHNHDDHYRTHMGDKPYKCDRCDSSFAWKSALHRHHKTHSLDSLEICTICKAKFKSGSQLVRHMNRFHSKLV